MTPQDVLAWTVAGTFAAVTGCSSNPSAGVGVVDSLGGRDVQPTDLPGQAFDTETVTTMRRVVREPDGRWLVDIAVEAS